MYKPNGEIFCTSPFPFNLSNFTIKISNITMQIFVQVVEQKLVLHNVDKQDQGSYACLVMDHSENHQIRREFVRIYDRNQSFLRVWHDGFNTLHRSVGNKDDTVTWVVEIAAHPAPTVTWYDPDGDIIEEGEDADRGRLVQTVFAKTSRSMLKLSDFKFEDSGLYSVRVENGQHEKTENFTLVVTDKPKVIISIFVSSTYIYVIFIN